MTILHCSQKLLKRLRQPSQLPDPAPHGNPLGAWCADIDFIDRLPFVVMMNSATGLVLVLPGMAADLKRLHEMAALQLAGLMEACGIDNALSQAELDALLQPFSFARSRDRSLVSCMNQRKYEAWSQFAHHRPTAFEVALRLLDRPFTRKDLGRDYHDAAKLLRLRLLPVAKILPFPVSACWH